MQIKFKKLLFDVNHDPVDQLNFHKLINIQYMGDTNYKLIFFDTKIRTIRSLNAALYELNEFVELIPEDGVRKV